jgi:hypothetical protein
MPSWSAGPEVQVSQVDDRSKPTGYGFRAGVRPLIESDDLSELGSVLGDVKLAVVKRFKIKLVDYVVV